MEIDNRRSAAVCERLPFKNSPSNVAVTSTGTGLPRGKSGRICCRTQDGIAMATRIEPVIGLPQTTRATDTESLGSLLRVLGVGFGLAVIIGNTLGAGILRNPAVVASQLPVMWMFIGVWIVGGLYEIAAGSRQHCRKL